MVSRHWKGTDLLFISDRGIYKKKQELSPIFEPGINFTPVRLPVTGLHKMTCRTVKVGGGQSYSINKANVLVVLAAGPETNSLACK